MTLLATLSYLAFAASAMQAAEAAMRRDIDVVAVLLLSTIVGLGGGTVRDLLIGAPVFWLRDGDYLSACALPVALVAVLGTDRLTSRVLLIADAIALGTWAVAGSLAAARAGASPGSTVAVGTIAAT